MKWIATLGLVLAMAVACDSTPEEMDNCKTLEGQLLDAEDTPLDIDDWNVYMNTVYTPYIENCL